jgi:hypothetical protein
VCSCGAPIGLGYHLRHCPRGTGICYAHNSLRDEVHAMAAGAGIVANTEVPGLLPGSDERPGDIVLAGVGLGGRDLVTDVTIVNALTDKTSGIEYERRSLVSGLAARRAEHVKRTKKGGAPLESMEDRLKARNLTFCPLAFTSSGTPGTSWHPLLNKISQFASERRGHDKAFFRMKWKVRIAMTLAKRGAQAMIRRALALRGGGALMGGGGGAAAGGGAYGGFGVEGPLLSAAT